MWICLVLKNYNLATLSELKQAGVYVRVDGLG